MSAIYEVNLSVELAIADAYEAWLPAHVQRMLRFDGFESAEILREENDNPAAVHWTVLYRIRDRKALQTYLDQHSKEMRQEAVDLFGAQFSARRRIFEKLS